MQFNDQDGFLLPKPKALECRPDHQFSFLGNPSVEKIWNSYGAAVLKYADIYNINPVAALATLATEAGAEGGFVNGRVTIRVEARPPILSRLRYGGGGAEFVKKYGKGQPGNWRALADWFKLQPDRSLQYTSFGVAQIMGFNAVDHCGYPSPMAMFDAFQDSADLQVKGFFDFVKTKDLIETANQLTSSNNSVAVRHFVKKYNGPGQIPTYSGWLQSNLPTAKKIMAKVR